MRWCCYNTIRFRIALRSPGIGGFPVFTTTFFFIAKLFAPLVEVFAEGFICLGIARDRDVVEKVAADIVGTTLRTDVDVN